ncbi:MAG: hypothetical protein AB2A00_26035 [Myxococcota bacterium]
MPPPGEINQAALEREIRRWVQKPRKRSSDYCSYPKSRLEADAREMQEGREDLDEFLEQETPITVRDFDWMDLLVGNLTTIDDDSINLSMDREVVGEDIEIAKRNVVDARAQLGLRAQASGIPLSGFSLAGTYDDPYALFSAAGRAARTARRRLDEFNGRDYTLRLIEDLEAKLGVLQSLIEGDEAAADGKVTANTRRAAVKRLLFDNLTYVGLWGRSISSGDPTRAKRYALDKIFPTRRTGTGPAADEDEGLIAAPDERVLVTSGEGGQG